MTALTDKDRKILKQLVANAIYTKFIEGDSYGFGTWEDFVEEADAAINTVLSYLKNSHED